MPESMQASMSQVPASINAPTSWEPQSSTAFSSLIGSGGSAAERLPKGTVIDETNLGLVLDVELNVLLRFGQRQLTLREVLDLKSGSVVELDRRVDEPVELLLDGRVIARGQAAIVDGNYGLRVTEIVRPSGTLRTSNEVKEQ